MLNHMVFNMGAGDSNSGPLSPLVYLLGLCLLNIFTYVSYVCTLHFVLLPLV